MSIFFNKLVKETAENSRLTEQHQHIQHGKTSCLLHSIAVAYYSFKFVNFFRKNKVLDNSLIRGALLQDYFLYDWHTGDEGTNLHGFLHPKRALENANKDFELNDIEANIIKNHMFPLTPVPPKYFESITVCLLDKICSIYETFKAKAYMNHFPIQSALSVALETSET